MTYFFHESKWHTLEYQLPGNEQWENHGFYAQFLGHYINQGAKLEGLFTLVWE